MIHRIYFILLLLSLSFTAKAQLGKELILNGGFEEYAKVTPPPSGEDDEEDEEEEPPGYFDPYQKPLYWYFNSSLFYTRTKDAHSGVFAVKVYPNGGSFFSRDENFNPYHIAINENFIFQKAINIVRIILNPIVMCVMLLMGYRAIGMVVVTTLFNVLTLLINCWYCYHRLHIHVIIGRFNWTFLKEIMIYSFWIFLNAIMDRIYWSSGQFILGIYAGAKAVAIYAVAISLENIYMSFSTAISGVFLPRITSMITQKENEKSMSDLFIRTGRIQYIIMSFILIGFILFGKQFIIIWAGSDYSEAYYITLLFFVPLTIPLIQNLGITILQARNQMKFRSVSYVIIAIISLGLSVFLVRYYGGIGCALSTAFALCIGQILIMNIYYFKKVNIDIPAFWREIGKMSVVPILIGIVGYVLLNYFRIESILTLFLVDLIDCHHQGFYRSFDDIGINADSPVALFIADHAHISDRFG